MARILSCKERVELRLKEILETITVSNGYNTTVSLVTRMRGTPQDRKKFPAINVWIGNLGTKEVDGNVSVEMFGGLAIAFSVWTADATKTESEANFLQSDIYRALIGADGEVPLFYVNSGTLGHAPVPVYLDLIGATTAGETTSGGGQVSGTFVYRVSWLQLRHDDQKFYREDTPVQEAA